MLSKTIRIFLSIILTGFLFTSCSNNNPVAIDDSESQVVDKSVGLPPVSVNQWTYLTGSVQLKSISNGEELGDLHGIDINDNYCYWSNNAWVTTTVKLSCVSAAAYRGVWGLDKSTGLPLSKSNGWTPLNGAVRLKCLAVTGWPVGVASRNADVWGINLDDKLVKWDGYSWNLIGNDRALSFITSGGYESLYGLDKTTGYPLKYDMGTHTWSQLGGAISFVNISANQPPNYTIDPIIIGVTSLGTSYRYVSGLWVLIGTEVANGTSKVSWTTIVKCGTKQYAIDKTSGALLHHID